jgi:hypothetical protein
LRSSHSPLKLLETKKENLRNYARQAYAAWALKALGGAGSIFT